MSVELSLFGGVPIYGLSRFFNPPWEVPFNDSQNQAIVSLQGWDEEALKPWIDACKCFHVVCIDIITTCPL
jgi:hypothetical protein